MKPTKTLAETRRETNSDLNVVASVEFVIRTELHDSVETDFVHSILGRITAEPESRGKEDAGHIGASLVQFGLALDHGISAERLGDGINGSFYLTLDATQTYLQISASNVVLATPTYQIAPGLLPGLTFNLLGAGSTLYLFCQRHAVPQLWDHSQWRRPTTPYNSIQTLNTSTTDFSTVALPHGRQRHLHHWHRPGWFGPGGRYGGRRQLHQQPAPGHPDGERDRNGGHGGQRQHSRTAARGASPHHR